MKILVLKFSDVYGPRDNPDKVIPRLITKALNNQNITLQNAKKSFDFIYVEDLVYGISKGINYITNAQENYFGAVSLCTGKPINLRQLAELIIKETSSDSKIIIETEQEEKQDMPNPEKARNILNFKAQINTGEGIARTVQYLKKRNLLKNEKII